MSPWGTPTPKRQAENGEWVEYMWKEHGEEEIREEQSHACKGTERFKKQGWAAVSKPASSQRLRRSRWIYYEVVVENLVRITQ